MIDLIILISIDSLLWSVKCQKIGDLYFPESKVRTERYSVYDHMTKKIEIEIEIEDMKHMCLKK